MLLLETAKGPFCQSCGMPLHHPSDFGTSADGRRVNDYCKFCFKRGTFTEPDLTEAGMIDRCITFTVSQTMMTRADAIALATDVVPKLKRWREAAVARHAHAA